MDVEHPIALVNAIHRALLDASAVTHVQAAQSDDMGHGASLLLVDVAVAHYQLTDLS
jgi:hypothetical protein